MTTRLAVGALLLLSLAAPVRAEVVGATANGFALKYVHDVEASPEAVYSTLTSIGRWWEPSHTYGGRADGLTLDARAGGCFCERLPSGSVQHMIVVHADASKRLTLQGGLGPLASLGVAGSMEWVLTPHNGGTHLEVTYNVGGYAPGGLAPLAPIVDAVLSTQVARLTRLVETGRPDERR